MRGCATSTMMHLNTQLPFPYFFTFRCAFTTPDPNCPLQTQVPIPKYPILCCWEQRKAKLWNPDWHMQLGNETVQPVGRSCDYDLAVQAGGKDSMHPPRGGPMSRPRHPIPQRAVIAVLQAWQKQVGLGMLRPHGAGIGNIPPAVPHWLQKCTRWRWAQRLC